jgi:hypothetical protein
MKTGFKNAIIGAAIAVGIGFASSAASAQVMEKIENKVVSGAKKTYSTGKKIGKGSYRVGQEVGGRVWTGSKWVGRKSWKGGTWVAVKTANGTKWVYRKSRNAIVGKPARRP